jgi:outer membrane protein TolC
VTPFARSIQKLIGILVPVLLSASLVGQTSSTPQSPSIQPESQPPAAASQTPSIQPENPAPQTSRRLQFEMPKSHNPLNAYAPDTVPEPVLTNSARLDQLIRDGKLYISLKDAIELALENNLDLAIARYNLPIANTDIVRTEAGGFFRGVNAGVVQGTPGGGVGGLGTGAPGAGAGGTTGGAGGAGAGASGLVQSTLGAGTPVSSYDPSISANLGNEHQTLPLSNLTLNGVPTLQTNTSQFNFLYNQAFATGTSISFGLQNFRQTTNSIFTNLSPSLNSQFRFEIQQQLLAGFGFGPNLRYLRIARNNKKISDIAFKDQVTATITQIENIYWDMVSAYEQTQVNEQSDAFAKQTLENTRKQLQLQAVPQMDVMRAEAEVSKRDQEMTVARTSLQLQETLMKNAVTKSLDDPTLEAMPVVPTDRMDTLHIRNRVAKADQYRSELEYRQAELRLEQLRKQVRIEVRNAQFALDQTGARVDAARKARDLAQRTFDITKKEQDLGAGSSYQTLSAQRDLALAELDLVSAMTIYQKAKVELDRATGTTLEHNGILIQDAISGVVSRHMP